MKVATPNRRISHTKTMLALTAIIALSACATATENSIMANTEASTVETAAADPAATSSPHKPIDGKLAASDPAYVQTIMDWRAKRVARLTSPDNWLTLVGLHWLEPGTHTIGSGEDNAIQIATGPKRLGVIELKDKMVHFKFDAAVGFGKIGEGLREGVLAADSSGAPTVVRFGETDFESSFTVIERSGKLGLRVKDNHAKTRTGFIGIEYYTIEPRFKLPATFTAHEKGKTIPIATVIGTLEDMANPGFVSFELGGQTLTMEAVDEGDGQLFFIFADRTSGIETYGPGRFLYTDPPTAGSNQVVIDFNKAYNPPCAFNAYSTCPLPPPENRVNAYILAGEKKYRGATH